MSLHVKSGGTWREGTPYVRQDSTWRPWKQAWVHHNGSWVEFYSQSETDDSRNEDSNQEEIDNAD